MSTAYDETAEPGSERMAASSHGHSIVMDGPPRVRTVRRWQVMLLYLLVFAASGAVVAYAWLDGAPGSGEVPIIRADVGPIKRSPEPDERGGLPIANGDTSVVEIFGGASGTIGTDTVVVPPDTAPRTLGDAAPELVDPPAAAPGPAPGAPEPLAPLSAPSLEAAPLTSADETPIADAATQTDTEDPVDAAEGPEPANVEATTDVPQAPVLPRARPTIPPEPSNGVASLPAPGPERAEPADAPVQTVDAAGSIWRVQLAALANEELVREAWAVFQSQYPDLLGQKSLSIQTTQTAAGTLFRMQAAGFSDQVEAADACARLKDDGRDCFVVGGRS